MNLFEALSLILLSFLPPIIYSIWLRNTEKFSRERWLSIFLCFIWGATLAILSAIIIELILGYFVITIYNADIYGIIGATVIAPLAEEFSKPLALGLKRVKIELDEPEDGLIYGAVAGLGFSATENLFYGLGALSEGFLTFLIIVLIRSFSGCLLHASATALTGYGYGKTVMKESSFLRAIPYFLTATVIHAIYNSIFVFGISIISTTGSLFIALFFVAFTIYIIRKKIQVLDMKNR